MREITTELTTLQMTESLIDPKRPTEQDNERQLREAGATGKITHAWSRPRQGVERLTSTAE